MQFPWVPHLESQGSDSSCSSNTSFAGGDRMVCNYTARAFRTLTYLSPGKEKDEKTSACLLVLTSQYRNLSFLLRFQQSRCSFSFFFPLPLTRWGLFWKFGAPSQCSFDDLQGREKKHVCKRHLWFGYEKWLLMREDNHCKTWGFCHHFKCLFEQIHFIICTITNWTE